MTALHDQIAKVGAAVGRLMALADNYDGVETLANIRADTAWMLVGNLGGAYDELTGFLQSAFKTQPEGEARSHE